MGTETVRTGATAARLLAGSGWPVLLALVAAIVASSQVNYLLFHTLAEAFAIVVAVLICVVAWETYPYSRNDFLIFIACGYFWIGMVDLAHTLAYKGMGILPGDNANLATQFWIAARYGEALVLLAAPLFLDRPVDRRVVFVGFGIGAVLVFGSILAGEFPEAYREGFGQTPIKIGSEYLIVLLLGLALLHLYRQRSRLDEGIFPLLALTLGVKMASELCFTFYVGVYDLSNMVGHILKLASFWLLFVAIVRRTLEAPYLSLTGEIDRRTTAETELAAANADLNALNRNLEAQVEERTRHLDQEIEARKEAERIVRDGAATLEAIVAGSLDAVVTMDAEGRIVEFNPAAEGIFGFRRDAVIGRELAETIVPERHRDAHRFGLKRYLATRVPSVIGHRAEMWARRADGSEFPVELAITAIGRGSAPPMFAGFLRDLTEEKRVERALQQSNRNLEQFAHAASHDLQRPLELIVRQARTIVAEAMVPAATHASQILAGALSMQALLRDLMDYCRPDTAPKGGEPVDLGLAAALAARDLESHIDQTGAQVILEDLPTVQADGDQMVRLFRDLMFHSIHHRHPERPPEIRLEATPLDGKWLLSLKNNGQSIAPDDQDRLFQAFHRGNGLAPLPGLGLAMCKRIVERHGGRIWARSENGSGATFFFTLPTD